jgi:serine/threonine protein kinase
LCDFGLAHVLEKGEESFDIGSMMLAVRWIAPDVFIDKRYGHSADVRTSSFDVLCLRG